MDEQSKGKIVSAIVPGIFLLGTKLGDWYEKNPHHKFKEGDVLILKDRRIFGYGIRPVIVVKGYEIRKDQFGTSGKYAADVYRDETGDFSQWMIQNKVLQGVERIITEHESHFKWNIENQFKKVPVKSIDEALAIYASQESDLQKRAA